MDNKQFINFIRAFGWAEFKVQRLGLENDVMILQEGSCMLSPELDVVIVNYNAGETLRACVESILASTGVRTRCIIIDNASIDHSTDFCSKYSPAEVLLVSNPVNVGFSSAVNQGVALSAGDWVMLLNPDTIVPDDSLHELLAVAQRSTVKKVGALGCLVRNPDLTEQRGCRRDIPTPAKVLAHAVGLHRVFPVLQFNHTGRPLPLKEQPVAAISGSCMLLNRQAYSEIGGFDEDYFLHFEDLDYCVRLHAANWQVMFVPFIQIEHLQGISSAQAPVRVILYKHISMLRFFYRHGGAQKVLLPILAPLIALRALAQIAVACFNKVIHR